MPKQNTPETVTFAFRLSLIDREWLETCARFNHVEVSQLVRYAVEGLQQYVGAHDGRLHLPIDITKFWQSVQAVQSVEPKLDGPASAPDDASET